MLLAFLTSEPSLILAVLSLMSSDVAEYLVCCHIPPLADAALDSHVARSVSSFCSAGDSSEKVGLSTTSTFLDTNSMHRICKIRIVYDA